MKKLLFALFCSLAAFAYTQAQNTENEPTENPFALIAINPSEPVKNIECITLEFNKSFTLHWDTTTVITRGVGGGGINKAIQFLEVINTDNDDSYIIWTREITVENNTIIMPLDGAITDNGHYTMAFPRKVVVSDEEEVYEGDTFNFTVGIPINVTKVTPEMDKEIESLSEVTIEFSKEIKTEWGETQEIKVTDAEHKIVTKILAGKAETNGKILTLKLEDTITKTGTYTFEFPSNIVKGIEDGSYQGGTFTFNVKDPVPFNITSTTPSTDEVLDSLDEITFKFSKELDAELGENRTITVIDEDANLITTILTKNATVNGSRLTLRLEETITRTGLYTFTLPKGLIKSVEGYEYSGHTFTFEVKDPVPFEVVEVTPSAKEVVDSLDEITFRFSKELDKKLASRTIKVMNSNDERAGTILTKNATVDGKVLTFKLEEPIFATDTYTIEFPSGVVRSIEGYEYSGEEFIFNVKEIVAFEVIDVTPAENEIVDTLSEITIEFTKELDKMGANKTIFVYDANNATAGLISTKNAVINGNRLTLYLRESITETGIYTFDFPKDILMSVEGDKFSGATFTFEVKAAEVEEEEGDENGKEEGDDNENGDGGEGNDGKDEGENDDEGDGDDVENGIEEVAADDKTVIYDIAGRRIAKITSPGIYIINGHKFLVR